MVHSTERIRNRGHWESYHTALRVVSGLAERFEEAHLDWVTDPQWFEVKENPMLTHVSDPAGILARVARKWGLFPEALQEYLKKLGYPKGPLSHLWLLGEEED